MRAMACWKLYVSGIPWSDFSLLTLRTPFWQILLQVEERKFFCAKFRGKYLRYLINERLAQGSRNAPLAWCRFIALISRITASVFAADPFQLQTFVDGPSVTVGGAPEAVDELIAAFILFWMILGLRLAFPKAQRGSSMIWIGARLSFRTDGVEVAIRGETASDLMAMLQEFLSKNLAPLKRLRSFAGKCAQTSLH